MAFDLVKLDGEDEVEHVVSTWRGEYETWAAAKAALVERTQTALDEAEEEVSDKEADLSEAQERFDALTSRLAEVEALDGPESPEGYETEVEEERTVAFQAVARKLREIIPAGNTSPAAARSVIAEEGSDATAEERDELRSIASRLFQECIVA